MMSNSSAVRRSPKISYARNSRRSFHCTRAAAVGWAAAGGPGRGVAGEARGEGKGLAAGEWYREGGVGGTEGGNSRERKRSGTASIQRQNAGETGAS
jgi:hypothetical protein